MFPVTKRTLSMDDRRQVVAALGRRFARIAGAEVKEHLYATMKVGPGK